MRKLRARRLRIDFRLLGLKRRFSNQVGGDAGWRMDRHLTFTADYAHFFAGDFLK